MRWPIRCRPEPQAEVTLFTPHVRVPDLVIVGSHCTGLDLVTAPLARAGLSVRSIAVGSLGGLAAAKRGECDLAPIHLFDAKTETYNAPFLADGLELVPGWRRMQGIVFRKGDARFEGLNAEAAVRAALADPACIMVNRNQGAGTRILIDRLLGDARPDGYWNQPRSHNAVAAAVAQHRADWGMTIAPVAHARRPGLHSASRKSIMKLSSAAVPCSRPKPESRSPPQGRRTSV